VPFGARSSPGSIPTLSSEPGRSPSRVPREIEVSVVGSIGEGPRERIASCALASTQLGPKIDGRPARAFVRVRRGGN